jgi:alkanesulfonate monooxygenase SsuD/methylene tetrahydromethanopterin reductase-like flavin-dependent oxidoreductase (luciferase family)
MSLAETAVQAFGRCDIRAECFATNWRRCTGPKCARLSAHRLSRSPACGPFLVERHFTGWNQVSATLQLLTWLAARTTTLRLGTAVLVLPWHNPVLLAEQAATLDLLSGGRLDFGIGKGYRHTEFEGFCSLLPGERPVALGRHPQVLTRAGRRNWQGRRSPGWQALPTPALHRTDSSIAVASVTSPGGLGRPPPRRPSCYRRTLTPALQIYLPLFPNSK